MLYLVVQSASERFAIEALRVVEVIPLVKVEPVAGLISPLAGLIRYQDTAVLVLELNQLLGQGLIAPARMCARIVLFGHPDCPEQLYGVRVDKVVGTLHADPA